MIAAVATVLLVSGAGSAHPLIASMHAPFWALVLGFAAAERFVVHIHFRRSATPCRWARSRWWSG